MKNILLPTDFSENSWNAISYALELYKDYKCNFTLLHTYTPIIYKYEYMQDSTTEFQVYDSIKETSNSKLDALLHRIQTKFKNPNHFFTQIVSFNALIPEINQLLEGHVMELIIMGTKGASGLKEILFGSNTVHVLKNAKCPVLAIPSDYSFEKPNEILFPSDYNIDFQEKHMQPILDIAKSNHSKVNILNVGIDSNLSQNQKQNCKKLKIYFNEIDHEFQNVSDQSVPEAIAKFQLKYNINLLVMINNKHTVFENLLFKSNIKQIGFHLNVPFLVIPSFN